MASVSPISEPFPIFEVAGRYMLYDLATVKHVREQHHIIGVLIGNIPIAIQQNVFNGLPLELFPEEVRLLVTNGWAIVVDDVASHLSQLRPMSQELEAEYAQILREKGLEAAVAASEKTKAKKAKWAASQKGSAKKRVKDGTNDSGEPKKAQEELALFHTPSPKPLPESKEEPELIPYIVTPTASYPPLTANHEAFPGAVPKATLAYPLFAHLHSKGYFMLPGLRFGCDFSVYPGDPLRFHSHFLAVGKAWDEPIDLIDIVAGGRLGTGVKKGYLLGAKDPSKPDNDFDASAVRTFCFEWAAM